MYGLLWITILVRGFGNDFHDWRSHEWKSMAIRLTSDRGSLFTGTHIFYYFLYAILCPGHRKTITHFAIVAKDRLFLVLWRHWRWHVTSRGGQVLVSCHICDCSCTRKLAQSLSSLVNNSRVYLFSSSGIHGVACKKAKIYLNHNSGSSTKCTLARTRIGRCMQFYNIKTPMNLSRGRFMYYKASRSQWRDITSTVGLFAETC